MTEKAIEQTGQDPQLKKILVVGAVLGLCVGVAGAYIYIQNLKDDEKPSITPGDGVKLGVLVFGLLRSIASLGEGKQG
jgi:hypothetical protein